MITVLFAAQPDRWSQYEKPLRAAFEAAGLDVNLTQSAEPEAVDYIVFAPNGPLRDFRPFTNLKAVLSLWAGVEEIVGNPTLTVPLCRMVDDGLSEGMVEWVLGHTLRHHLGMDLHILGQDGVWRSGRVPPLARDRQIGILGLGALGSACAEALLAVNFKVAGWSRTPKSVDGVTCYSGDEGLTDILGLSDILILLLPQTAQTHHILNSDSLSKMKRGAIILNPGRGPLIDDDALLQALESGRVGHATLDVFETEPLPRDHPYWAHKSVTVTPHIAAETRPDSAARVIAENVRRGEAGESLKFLVDRDAGY